jgi:tetratricopeptide (TPR) repeat protein
MSSRKRKSKKSDHSQRMSRLKAKALAHVAERAAAGNERYKTVALLTEALRRDPDNHTIMLNLAVAHGRRRDYEHAEKLLARVLELAPRNADVCHRAGVAFLQIERPERAAECYRRALELSSDPARKVITLLELAKVCERRHRLDEALAAVQEALQLDPRNDYARLQHALLDARRGETARAEADLRSLAADATCPVPTRIEAGYELAQLLDKHQQYDAAFQALLATKPLLKPMARPFQLKNQGALMKTREILQMIDAAWIDRLRQKAQEDSPYRCAALTGHPRSGTTLVEQVLDGHSELVSADEFDVFTEWIYLPLVSRFPFSEPILRVLDRVPPHIRQQARATYWQRMEAVLDQEIGGRMLLDKNPGMMLLLPVVNWAFPEMKMLIALRDPRDVVLSCFMQKVLLTQISVNWLSLPAAADYYVKVMSTWVMIRDLTPNPWLEFRYEDVVADLEVQSRKICDFLGLPWDNKVLKFYEHAREKVVRSPTYRDVTQPVYQKSVGRWQHYAAHLEPILKTLEPFVKEFGYT